MAADIRKDMDSLFNKLKKTRDKNDRFKMRGWPIAKNNMFIFKGEIKGLKKELYEREDKVIKELVANTDVILCTNVGAADRVIKVYFVSVFFLIYKRIWNSMLL